MREVNVAAFGRPDEARLVDALRIQAKPFLSLVAVRADEVMGNIVFTPMRVEAEQQRLMALAPMAVKPQAQRRGIGSALVRTGLERCRSIGAVAVVVLGHPEYYPKFGFVPATRFGLSCEYEVPEETFMALELEPGALAGLHGTVRYHPAFAQL